MKNQIIMVSNDITVAQVSQKIEFCLDIFGPYLMKLTIQFSKC